MCQLMNITDQTMNITLDHKLYQARIAMRQVMREGYEVLAINVNPERPVLHIAPPDIPIAFMVESVQFDPQTSVHTFRAQINQCGARIADLVWTTPCMETAIWAS